MSFRITTRGVLRNYRSELNNNYKELNSSMEKVSTERKFNSYAEDPAAANKAFLLRRTMQRTEDHINNTNYIISKFQVAYNAVEHIVDGDGETPDLSGIKSALTALNDTAGMTRPILGKELMSKAEAIVHSMNNSITDEYVFAGADGLNVPFSWDTDANGHMTLLYRGVNVNGTKTSEDTESKDTESKGTEIKDTEGALRSLKNMADEKTYVDIGIGFSTATDSAYADPSTAFNSSLSGLDFLGYGTDGEGSEVGDPKNLAQLMHDLGELLSTYNTEKNEYPGKDKDEEKVSRLTEKLLKAISNVQEKHVTLSADVAYLNSNLEQLKEKEVTINEQVVDLERMEPAEAIMQYNWAIYSYNAALRIGTTLLSQSLLDYMS